MFIQFNDAGNVGGAAQGIIPVQDGQGNMLGGSAGSSQDQLRGVQREARGVRNELGMLESHFERMMEAMEKNTEQIAQLAEERKAEDARVVKTHEGSSSEVNFSISKVSMHLSRMSDLMERNQEHVERLAQRQAESEEKMRAMLESSQEHKRADYLDMSQLSSHLDRIQKLMERNMHERKDSAKDLRASPPRGPQRVDFSPLTDRLEKVFSSIEQNNKLMREVLDKNRGQEKGNTSPMEAQLERIHDAIESQSSHMQALVGFATGGDGDDDQGSSAGPVPPQNNGLAPLGEHLEQIYNAVEEGNEQTKKLIAETSRGIAKQKPVNFEPLEKKLNDLIAVQKQAELDLSPLSQRLDDLLDAQENASTRQQEVDAQMAGRVDKILDAQHKVMERGPFDVSLLSQRLDEILSVHRESATADLVGKLDEIVQAQGGIGENGGGGLDLAPLTEKMDEVIAEVATARDAMDFAPMVEHLEAIRTAAENNPPAQQPLLDLDPLTKHLEALRATSDKTQNQLSELLKAHAEDCKALVAAPNSNVDFTPLSDRLQRIHSTLESQQTQQRDLSPNSGGSGDSRFLISALTSHLSKIQAVTETNAKAIRTLRESHSAAQDKMHIAVSETSDQIKALLSQNGDLAAQNRNLGTRVGVREGQVQELLRTQTEVVECVRELAGVLKEENKKACGHVVVPPPRKMGRKVVGFVYEGGQGGAA